METLFHFLVALILAHPEIAATLLGLAVAAVPTMAAGLVVLAKRTRNTVDDRMAAGLQTVLGEIHPALVHAIEKVKTAKSEADLKAIGKATAAEIVADVMPKPAG